MSEKARARVRPVDFPDPIAAERIEYDPSMEDLRAFSSALETTTENGSPSYVSEHRSRNADRTKNAVDHGFGPADYEIIQAALEVTREGDRELVCVDRQVGRHPEASYVCRLFVPREYARIALAWAKLLEPAPEGADPDFVTVQLPDRERPRIRILPEEGVTAVLGTDYTGEAKKSFLRLFMYRVKQAGGLGLHAGSKRVCLTDEAGRDTGDDRPGTDGDGSRTVGQVFLGLSGTGKSTLTSHGLWLDDPEGAEMLQDDVCALLSDGTVAGSEGEGLYVKTIDLDEDEQPELYGAATDESAVLENVAVDENGTVHFDEDRYTTNSRAVIARDCLDSASEDLDLERVDQLFFITRNPLVPPIAKLSPDQAAAAFMLGESIETSAGDPERAGEAIRVVGTNPFVVGPEGAEGNRFRDLIADLEVDSYVINTGEVGTDDPIDVGVEETVSLLEQVARGRIEWEYDDRVGLTVPVTVPGLDVEDYALPGRVEDFEETIATLRQERRAYLRSFDRLDESIREAVY
jgi:phosphoenolpyruvate carboxykinase (ATP)